MLPLSEQLILGRTKEELEGMALSDLSSLVSEKFIALMGEESPHQAENVPDKSGAQVPNPHEMEADPEGFAGEQAPVAGLDAGIAATQDVPQEVISNDPAEARRDAARISLARQHKLRARAQEEGAIV